MTAHVRQGLAGHTMPCTKVPTNATTDMLKGAAVRAWDIRDRDRWAFKLVLGTEVLREGPWSLQKEGIQDGSEVQLVFQQNDPQDLTAEHPQDLTTWHRWTSLPIFFMEPGEKCPTCR